MVFIVVFLNEGPLEKQHLLKGYPSQIYQIKSNIRLRNSEIDLLLPRMKTSNGQKAFSFRGAKVWNELEQGIKLAPFLSTFKRRFSNK